MAEVKEPEILDKAKISIILEEIAKWCIYAIVFAAPFSKSISEIAIVIAIVSWCIKKALIKDISLPKSDLNLFFLIFVLAAIPSFFNSGFLALSIKAFFTKFLKYVVLYFVIIDTLKTKSRLKGLFVVVFLSAVLITIDGFWQYRSGIDFLHHYPAFKARPINDREGLFLGFPTACFPFPNDLAAWILLVLFPISCAVILDLKNNSKVRYLAAFASLGLAYLFFLTKTRGAWLGLAVSTVYIALSKKKIWLIILLIIAIAVPFLLKMEMANYIFAFTSVGDRYAMWKTGWEIFKDHPVVGNGLNTFFSNFMKYRDDEWKGKKGSYAHNCYLQMAADTGIIGLASFLWLMVVYFISVAKGLKKITDPFYSSILWGSSIGLFSFLVHSFFDTNLYSLNLATLFWTWIGISQSIVQTCRDRDT